MCNFFYNKVDRRNSIKWGKHHKIKCQPNRLDLNVFIINNAVDIINNIKMGKNIKR